MSAITSPLGFELTIGDRVFRADTPRGIVADCLAESGRDHEARLLRTDILVNRMFSRVGSGKVIPMPIKVVRGVVCEKKSRSAEQRFQRVRFLSQNGRFHRTFSDRWETIPPDVIARCDSLQIADLIDNTTGA